MSLTDPTPANPKPERSVRHGLIEDWRDGVGILLLLLVAAFMGALIPRYLPGAEENKIDTDLAARVASLEAGLGKEGAREVTALKDRVAKLEKRQRTLETTLSIGATSGAMAGVGAALAAPPGTAVSESKQLADLAARLSALETRIGSAPDDIKAAKGALDALSATIGTVDARLAKLEGSDLLELARRASLATAVANLTRAAQGSSPFKTEFDVVAAMLPGEKRLSDIEPLAAKGLRTTGTLIAIFGNTSDAALDAERVAKADGWWERLWAGFMGLISTRSTGEVKGNSTEARLARAGERMKAGDLAAAVKELRSIRGAAREPLREWLTEADARVKLEATLAEVNTNAIQSLMGPAAGDEPVPQLPEP
jgi:hypothetical protein